MVEVAAEAAEAVETAEAARETETARKFHFLKVSFSFHGDRW